MPLHRNVFDDCMKKLSDNAKGALVYWISTISEEDVIGCSPEDADSFDELKGVFAYLRKEMDN